MEEFLWTEKYRPHKVEDCVLPDRLKKIFSAYVKDGEIPNLLLAGSPGSGKTTVAKAMCEEIGCSYMYINASLDRGIDTIRNKIVGYASTCSLVGGRKVIILDEADGLTKETQDALRGAIENFSSNCTFILTCNHKAKLLDAIHSRSAVIEFHLHKDEKPKMAASMMKRLETILTTEGITYDKPTLVKLIGKFFPDYRRLLGELQRFASGGSIDAGVVAQLDNIRGLDELVKALKDKDFGAMRKWVTLNSDMDPTVLFRSVYDGLISFLKPDTVPMAVVIIAKYQYQSAFVADQEINTVACMTELMVECEVK